MDDDARGKWPAQHWLLLDWNVEPKTMLAVYVVKEARITSPYSERCWMGEAGIFRQYRFTGAI